MHRSFGRISIESYNWSVSIAMEMPNSNPNIDESPVHLPVQPGMFDDIPEPPAQQDHPGEDEPEERSELVFREHDEFGEWLDRNR